MSEIVYAVHTRACTYLLDEDGFCKWVLSRSGAKSDDRCVGAQFVAALDLRSKGGLVGELRIGAQALFIRHEDGRFALIRTKPIEHVEIRGEDAEGDDPDAAGYEGQVEQEGEPVVLPDHLAVAAVFNAPVPSPEPPPPSARVILQTAQQPRTEPPPPMASAPYAPGPSEPYVPPAPPPVRGFPSAPPRDMRQSLPRDFPRAPDVPAHTLPAYAEPRGYEPAPPAYVAPVAPPPAATRKLPEAPPRVRNVGSPRRDPSQETQPLPPAGPVPAWPPMLAPPPPQAEMMPLGPARPHLPSAEELDAEDLEEVNEDDQIYSMEVTLSLPLFRSDPHAQPAGARGQGEARPLLPNHLWRR